MIIFENEGTIDLLAVTTFGVNVKEGENPIGFFGTGFKYAVAVLLRNGHRVRLQNGLDEHEFHARKEVIRGEIFNIVMLDDQRLGFTTDVGKTWEMWMTYRELFCNAIDEKGGTVFEYKKDISPQRNRVRVIVEGGQFLLTHQRRHEFLLTGEPFYSHDGLEFHHGRTNYVFYRGIRVAKMSRLLAFTLNFKKKMELTEDRTLQALWRVEADYASAIIASEDEIFIREALTAKGYEAHLYFAGKSEDQLSSAFKRVLADLYANKAEIASTARNLAQSLFGKKELEDTIILTDLQKKIFERACNFLRKIGYDPNKYPVVFIQGISPNLLGEAKDGTVYITSHAFSYGTKTVAGTLLEEIIHLTHSVSDESREMQRILLNKIISMGEEMSGEPL